MNDPIGDLDKRFLVLENLLSGKEESLTSSQLRDVRTELLSIFAAMRRSLRLADRQDDLFMRAPDPYFITDRLGQIIEVNVECLRFLNLPIGVISHKPLTAFIDDAEDSEALNAKILRLWPSEHIEVETSIKPYGMEKRYVLLSGTMIGQSEDSRILWLIRDLTYRVQVEQKLRESSVMLESLVEERTADLREALESLRRASSAKDEFLALVSHELKTPLTVISGYTNFLRRHEETVDTGTRRMILSDVDQQAHRLESLLNNLMALARLDPNSSRDLEPVALQHVIHQEVSAARARDPGLHVRLSVPARLPPVYGLETYISQILQNLLNNAQKYASGHRVDVTARRFHGDVIVSVRDYGPGIPDEIAERIFEPFFRGSVKDDTPGTGIGLSVCRRLVEAQEGELRMTRPRGRGTRFSFALRAISEGAE